MKKSTKSAQQYNKTKAHFRFTEFVLIFFLLLLAVTGIVLFRQDLLQTINLQNKEPAGIVIIKKNIVQRRHGDRVLWDRLANESPVYLDDLIRVADISSASLDIENNSIELDENTLIRISLSPDGEGLQIELSSGKLSVSSGTGSKGISLELKGQRVQTNPGTVLSAASGETGVSLQVSSGIAHITKSGDSREGSSRAVSSGERIALNSSGREVFEKAVVIIRPIQNARYLKNGNEPVSVDFEWNRINFLPEEKLRLEIAMDRRFNQIFRVINGLDRQTRVFIDRGLWYWRLSFGNTILTDGRITVADGAGLQLVSPALNSLYRYRDNPPVMNFQWSQEEDASSYIIEVSRTTDFSASQIRAQVASANYSDSSLGAGTWYWRVMPVFPGVFNGKASFSNPSFFRIEQGSVESAVAFAGQPAAGQTTAESSGLDELLTVVTPSKNDLPPDLPPELAPKPEPKTESVPETKPETKPAAKPEPKPETKPKPEPKPEPKPKPEQTRAEVRLLLPMQRARIDGLTAMSQQTIFTWECSVNVERSRFVLSRNPNPLQGNAAVEIQNPGPVIRLDRRLEEGVWYWNVEARTRDGITVSAPAARQFQVMPVPLLPPPGYISPRMGQRYGLEELRHLKNIVFEWKPVDEADAYIFTLYQQTEDGRRQIIETNPSAMTSFLLDNLKMLDNGIFYWQVEAVSMGRNGEIVRRGRPGEYIFIFDFPPPDPVQIENTEIFYGN